MEHVHKDLIIAWANGAKIEYYCETNKQWFEINSPGWDEKTKYRIKTTEAEWIKVDGVRPADINDSQCVEWYSADGRMSKCFIGGLNFGASQKDPKRVVFIRILKDE